MENLFDLEGKPVFLHFRKKNPVQFEKIQTERREQNHRFQKSNELSGENAFTFQRGFKEPLASTAPILWTIHLISETCDFALFFPFEFFRKWRKTGFPPKSRKEKRGSKKEKKKNQKTEKKDRDFLYFSFYYFQIQIKIKKGVIKFVGSIALFFVWFSFSGN